MSKESVTLRSSVKRLKPDFPFSKVAQLKTHPLADNFPPMSAERLQALADDILENGLREPIILTPDGSTIIDGRDRLRACGVVGVEPRFRQLPNGTSEAEMLRIMVAANRKTRDLSLGQLAALGHYFYEIVGDAPWDDFANFPDPKPRKDVRRTRVGYVSAAVGASHKAIWQAKTIIAHRPDLMEKVFAGELSLNAAGDLVSEIIFLENKSKPLRRPMNKPPTPRDTTRKAVEARVTWLRYLAAEKLTAMEISQKLEITEEHVRRLSRRYEVDLPGDVWGYKRRKPTFDVNRVAQVVADDLMAMSDSLPRIKDGLEQLDPERIDEWIRIYERSARQLSQLAKTMKTTSKG